MAPFLHGQSRSQAVVATIAVTLLWSSAAGCSSPPQRIGFVAGAGVVDSCLEDFFATITVTISRTDGRALRLTAGSMGVYPGGVLVTTSNGSATVLVTASELTSTGMSFSDIELELAFTGAALAVIEPTALLTGTAPGFEIMLSPRELELGDQAITVTASYVGPTLPCAGGTDAGAADGGSDAGGCPVSCALGCRASGECRRFAPTNTDPAALVWDDPSWATAQMLVVTAANDAIADTDACVLTSGTAIIPGTVESQIVGGAQQLPLVCELRLTSLTVEAAATLSAAGARPLRILVTGDVTIPGTISVAAAGPTPGAGGGLAGVPGVAGLGPSGGYGGAVDDGGGGGCFGGIGASGGGNPCACAACEYGDPLLRPLQAGSGGGGGGGGEGGGAGGAVQISALGALVVTGAVFAGGGGGRGSLAVAGILGAGGGGSGGAILLESYSIVVDGAVANGGAGGGGSATGVDGTPGADGASCAPAVGGGFGGGAGADADNEAVDGATSAGAGSGGGGGAVGRIVFIVPGAAPGLVTSAGCITPLPSYAAIVAETL